MVVVSMSTQEFSRLQVLLDVQSGRLRVEDAAQLIGLGRRQIFRLLNNIQASGPAGLISKRRGRPSNRHLPRRTGNWRWHWCVGAMPISAHRWRPRADGAARL